MLPHPTAAITVDAELLAPGSMLADTRGRLLRDLRISVTDRCNLANSLAKVRRPAILWA